ncbi:MAG: hypothetical protein KF723_21875 [Rhizobiaceae bacterium]|nr:hypothetical protein [Rhizobiaceae bacterium]
MIRTLLSVAVLTLVFQCAPASAKEATTAVKPAASEIQASRVKTSDKQRKAVLDFIKG